MGDRRLDLSPAAMAALRRASLLSLASWSLRSASASLSLSSSELLYSLLSSSLCSRTGQCQVRSIIYPPPCCAKPGVSRGRVSCACGCIVASSDLLYWLVLLRSVQQVMLGGCQTDSRVVCQPQATACS